MDEELFELSSENIDFKEIVDRLSLTGNAFLFGSAASGKLDITDVDALENIELSSKDIAKEYAEKLQRIAAEKYENMLFVNFEGGNDQRFVYDKSILSKDMINFNEEHFLNWLKTTEIKDEHKKEIADVLASYSKNSVCAIIKIKKIIKTNYNLLNWNQNDIAKGFLMKNGKKFLLEDILMHPDTNIKFVFMYKYHDKFVEIEMSYKFFYEKDGFYYGYNTTNNDMLYDLYKFLCKKNYIKVLKRLRSITTKLLFYNVNDVEDNMFDSLQYFLEIYSEIFDKKVLSKVRKDIYKNVHEKIAKQNAKLARIKAILTVDEHNLFEKFGVKREDFIPDEDLLLERKKKIEHDMNEYGKKMFKKYLWVIRRIVDINCCLDAN